MSPLTNRCTRHASAVTQSLFDPRDSERKASYVVIIVQSPTDLQILYAGTSGGAYRSTDGGNTWQRVKS